MHWNHLEGLLKLKELAHSGFLIQWVEAVLTNSQVMRILLLSDNSLSPCRTHYFISNESPGARERTVGGVPGSPPRRIWPWRSGGNPYSLNAQPAWWTSQGEEVRRQDSTESRGIVSDAGTIPCITVPPRTGFDHCYRWIFSLFIVNWLPRWEKRSLLTFP